MSKSQMETVLTSLFDVKGTIHFEFTPQGQTGSQTFYIEIVKWLYEAVHRQRPELRHS
jgi:hypothetical protein